MELHDVCEDQGRVYSFEDLKTLNKQGKLRETQNYLVSGLLAKESVMKRKSDKLDNKYEYSLDQIFAANTLKRLQKTAKKDRVVGQSQVMDTILENSFLTKDVYLLDEKDPARKTSIKVDKQPI